MDSQATIADERGQLAGFRPAHPRAPSPATRWPASVGAAWRPYRVRLPAGSWSVVAGAIERERARGTGFLFLPVFMGLGVLAYLSAGEEPAWPPILLMAALLAALAGAARERPVPRAIAIAGLMAALGAGAAKFETQRASTVVTGSAVTTRVTGTVARIETLASGRVRLTLDLTATERPRLRYAPARARLTARAVPAGLAPGDAVTGAARLMPPSGPVRPGGYDFAFASYFDRIGAIGFFMGDPQRAEPSPAPPVERLGHRIEAIRLALAERVRRQVGGAEGEIAATLIAGMRAGIPETSSEALRRTGLAHILAISGLHMALVAATVMGGLRLAFALAPNWSARRPVKKYAAVAALAACAFYLAISGMAVAAQRSFVMLAVMLLALLFDRAALTMRNLAIAALVVLAVSPHELVGPSFQMSFAATAVLIGAYSAWSDRRARRARRQMPANRGIAARVARVALLFTLGLATTSILAGLATTLYGVQHFHRVSPYALQANMLAMPVVSLVVMPMAVLSVIAMPFGLEAPFLAVMGRGLGVVNAVATWFSERSPVDAVGAIPTAAFLLLSLALVIATLLATWLRCAAVIVALAGFAALGGRDLPAILISEDARLVALARPDGTLALNRDRPNGFTIQNWLFAQAADGWSRPRKVADRAAALDAAHDAGGFACAGDVCLARHGASGALVAHVPDARSARAYCASAALIVIADATAGAPCRGGTAMVVSARDLALRGSAAVHLDAPGDAGNPAAMPRIHFAMEGPIRPWHAHRRFSREARGLPPRRPAE